MDRFNKQAHFIPVKTTYKPPDYAEIYLSQIIRLHGIPKVIISDLGPQFIAHFWHKMQTDLGTQLIHSTAYHPQTSGQTERVNQILEDLLRACVLSAKGSWEKWLPLAEFSYNNSYQESIQMSPFEALYGRRCRTPANWIESGERRLYGVDFVDEAAKQVQIIQKHILAAQSRQKSYVDTRRRPLEFKVNDYVYLKVSPMRNVKRFGMKRKLSPRFVGPYRILEKKGVVAYKLELPEHMSSIFPVFHVSQLKKCLRVPEEEVQPRNIQLRSDLTYTEEPLLTVLKYQI